MPKPHYRLFTIRTRPYQGTDVIYLDPTGKWRQATYYRPNNFLFGGHNVDDGYRLVSVHFGHLALLVR